MRKRLLVTVLLCVIAVVEFQNRVSAQEFYAGKTIRFIVGFSAGGGFDAFTRTIARHMNKHIPGNPSMLVENMTGAGSIIAANYIYNRAKPDGLTIGNWGGGLVLQQLIGGQKGIEFDARKFEWIGLPAVDTSSCALTKASGITTLKQWLAAKEPVKLGGITPGSLTSDAPRILKAALNLPIQLIEGYKATPEIRMAADSGEVSGGCWGWETVKVVWRKGLESGDVKVLIQAAPRRHPELPDVPNAIDLATTEEARQMIKTAIIDPGTIIRAYSLPPGTPKDKVNILRKAFMATMKDPAFVADAKKAELDLFPIAGDEVERIVQGVSKTSPKLVAKLRDVLVPKK
jgi:tripartite-type tricarboxylate transporter receptor subunit TctC